MLEPYEKFLILVPCFEEQGNVLRTADAIHQVLAEHQLDADVLFVNDGSTDGTSTEIAQAEQRYNNVLSIHHLSNYGFGAALRTGFLFCKQRGYSFVCHLECDLTSDPKHIPLFRDKVLEGYKLVVGSRFTGGGEMVGVPMYRRIISGTGSLIARCCFGIGINDYTLGFRAISTDLLHLLKLKQDGFPIVMEEIAAAVRHTSKIGEVPVVLTHREIGASHFRYTPAVVFTYLMIALRALITAKGDKQLDE